MSDTTNIVVSRSALQVDILIEEENRQFNITTHPEVNEVTIVAEPLRTPAEVVVERTETSVQIASEIFLSDVQVVVDHGPKGDEGKSAYQVAVDNGYVGTEAEWLASLKGDKGDTGLTGSMGPEGPAGPQGLPGTPAGPSQFTYWMPNDPILLDVGHNRLYNRSGQTLTITGVYLGIDTPPTGTSIVVDVNKNGVTIFTNQAHRPQIAATDYEGFSTQIDIAALENGSYLTVDVDQVGSSFAGSYLSVAIVATRS